MPNFLCLFSSTCCINVLFLVKIILHIQNWCNVKLKFEFCIETVLHSDVISISSALRVFGYSIWTLCLAVKMQYHFLPRLYCCIASQWFLCSHYWLNYLWLVLILRVIFVYLEFMQVRLGTSVGTCGNYFCVFTSWCLPRRHTTEWVLLFTVFKLSSLELF